MKKKSLRIIVIFLLMSTILFVLPTIQDNSVKGFSGAGTGTVADPYQITDAGELNETRNDLDANYSLMNDIDLYGCDAWNGGLGFNPIGNVSNPFTGSFDGDNYTIDTLSIFNDTNDYQGLFGAIDNAIIKNIHFEDLNVQGKDYVGGIVGYCTNSVVSNCDAHTGGIVGMEMVGGFIGKAIDYSNVINCYVDLSSVDGNDSVGGLIGYIEINCNISNCCANCAVIGTDQLVGGLIGQVTYSNVSSCYATGDISGLDKIGGLIGQVTYSNVSSCYASGDVTGVDHIGGLIGRVMYSNVSNCYATGDVTGDYEVGGLVGWFSISNVSNCYATGDVNGFSDMGGLLGTSYDSNVSNCYATGNILGTVVGNNDNLGGLIGYISIGGNVSNCYATGDVTGDDCIGGLIGINEKGIITDCTAYGTVTYITSGGWLIGCCTNCAGGLKINAFNETSNTGIGFDVSIFNELGTLIYTENDCVNTHWVNFTDMSSVFYNVTIIISNDTYDTSRTYTTVLIPYMYRTLNAYLPYTAGLYLLNVIGPPSDVYENPPLEDVNVLIKGLIGTSYQNVSNTYTDSNGQTLVYLVPGHVYTVKLSKTNYVTRTEYYIPSSTVFTYTFRMSLAAPVIPICDFFYTNISFTATMLSNNSIYVTYNDINLSTVDVNISVFSCYNGTDTLNCTYNSTSDNFSFYITGINITREYLIVMYFNNTANFCDQTSPVYKTLFPIAIWTNNTKFDLDDRITKVIGPSTLGPWPTIISCILPILLLVSLGPYNVGAAIISAGAGLGLMQGIFGLWLLNGFNPLLAVLVPVIIILGIMYIMAKGQGADQL